MTNIPSLAQALEGHRLDNNVGTQATIKALEAREQLIVQEAKRAELLRAISFFDDEGRESKYVLKAFVKNRLKELEVDDV